MTDTLAPPNAARADLPEQVVLVLRTNAPVKTAREVLTVKLYVFPNT